MSRLYLQLNLLLAILVSGIFHPVASAATNAVKNNAVTNNTDITLLSQWIQNLQFSDKNAPGYGAIRVHHTFAATGADGTPYFRVSPYDANLAVLGLLHTRTPQSLQVAERWIMWYFRHLTPQSAPDGVPLEHFYTSDGKRETTCVKPGDARLCHFNDATDSAAATFFCVLAGAQRNGLSRSVLLGQRAKIENLASVLLKLQQNDGLCWAKADYPAKYLEDNCEVFAGLRDLAFLERAVFGDEENARFYENAATKVQTAIVGELYDTQTQRYRVAKFEDGTFHSAKPDVWFPDTQAQMWPHLWGVVAPDDEKTKNVANSLESVWNGAAKPDWDTKPQAVNGGSIEAGAAFAMRLAGYADAAQNYLAAVKELKFPSKNENAPRNFSWPFPVSDAGWLIALLAMSEAQI